MLLFKMIELSFNCNYLKKVVLDYAIICIVLSVAQFTCSSLHC